MGYPVVSAPDEDEVTRPGLEDKCSACMGEGAVREETGTGYRSTWCERCRGTGEFLPRGSGERTAVRS